ncbi:hypothetical protein LWI28_010507 [Acer negundo]|uniref:Uncharacterized protein n=1 Tax=Acer negundo TaxID=4023 RepID=A0AAD5IYS3_ACENE|nr:hypothetical protein LWI28_010507 [Acer negundo]
MDHIMRGGCLISLDEEVTRNKKSRVDEVDVVHVKKVQKATNPAILIVGEEVSATIPLETSRVTASLIVSILRLLPLMPRTLHRILLRRLNEYSHMDQWFACLQGLYDLGPVRDNHYDSSDSKETFEWEDDELPPNGLGDGFSR